MILKGANLDLTDKYGKSALMYAVSNLNYDLVRELINNGANINITDENGSLAGRG